MDRSFQGQRPSRWLLPPTAECDAGGGALGRDRALASGSQELGEYDTLSPLTCPMDHTSVWKRSQVLFGQGSPGPVGSQKAWMGWEDSHILKCETGCSPGTQRSTFLSRSAWHAKQSWSSLRTLDAGLRWFECHKRGGICGHSQTGRGKPAGPLSGRGSRYLCVCDLSSRPLVPLR